MRTISANQVKAGDWLVYANPRMNERVVDVSSTHDGQVKLHTDFGNGGEPATHFLEPAFKVHVA